MGGNLDGQRGVAIAGFDDIAHYHLVERPASGVGKQIEVAVEQGRAVGEMDAHVQMRRDSGFGHFSLRMLSLRQKVGDRGDLIGFAERRRMAAIGDFDDPRGRSAGGHFGGHVEAQ